MFSGHMGERTPFSLKTRSAGVAWLHARIAICSCSLTLPVAWRTDIRGSTPRPLFSEPQLIGTLAAFVLPATCVGDLRIFLSNILP